MESTENKVISYFKMIEWLLLIGLVVLSPLMNGSVAKWQFIVCLWVSCASFASMLIQRLWSGKRLIPKAPINIPISLILTLSIVSIVWSINYSDTLWAISKIFMYAIVYLVALDIIESRVKVKWLLRVILFTGILISSIGIIKYFNFNLFDGWQFSSNNILTRLNSTFINPDHAAGYLSIVFFIGLGMFLYPNGNERYVYLIGMLISLIAILMTMSRGAFISASISLAYIFAIIMIRKKINNKILFVYLVGLLAVFVLVTLGSEPLIDRLGTMAQPGDSPSLKWRIAIWRATIEIIKEHPFTGTGLGTYPWSFMPVRPEGMHSITLQAHNDYLQLVSEIGLFVLIPLGWIIALFFKKTTKMIKYMYHGLTFSVCVGASGAILAILIHSIYDFNLQITSNGLMVSILFGLGLKAGIWQKSQAEIKYN